MPSCSGPMLVLWGDRDPFTPADGPVGRFFQELPTQREGTNFQWLKSVGHCPFDDDAEASHAAVLPWLKTI
jgi:pimeloyl-ACP methyl ester carboxylesterase